MSEEHVPGCAMVQSWSWDHASICRVYAAANDPRTSTSCDSICKHELIEWREVKRHLVDEYSEVFDLYQGAILHAARLKYNGQAAAE